MSVIDCFVALLFINDVLTTIFIIIWAILVVTGWTTSLTFTFQLCKESYTSNKSACGCRKNRSSSNSNRTFQDDADPTKVSKHQFDFVMIVTVLMLSTSLTTYFIWKVFDIHNQFPSSRTFDATSSDEACSNVNLDDISAVMWPIVAFIGALSYLMIVNVYYFRLLIIFQNSIFEISKCKQTSFKVLCLFCAVIAIIGIILQSIFNLTRIMALCGLIFGLIYFFESNYLCYVLRKKLLELINMLYIPPAPPKSPSLQSSATSDSSNNNHNSSNHSNYNRHHDHHNENSSGSGDNLSNGDITLKMASTGSIDVGSSKTGMGNANIGSDSPRVGKRSASAISNTQDIEKRANKKINDLFDVTKRFSILTYCSLLMTVFSMIIITFTDIVFKETKLTVLIAALTVVIDENISILCIALQFPFADPVYKCLCGKCERLSIFVKRNVSRMSSVTNKNDNQSTNVTKLKLEMQTSIKSNSGAGAELISI